MMRLSPSGMANLLGRLMPAHLPSVDPFRRSNRGVIISCHIGKTGGTSLRRLLRDLHGDRLVFITKPPGSGPIPLECYPLLRHHYFYALSIDSHDLRYVPPETFWPGARFAVILREPLETFLSGYFFVRHHVGQRVSVDNAEERETWLRQHFPKIEELGLIFSNNMTRFLSWRDFFTPVPDEALETAKRELVKYDYIGLNERMDELPQFLARDFPEFAGRTIPKENVTPKSGGDATWAERVDRKTLEFARQAVRLDLELYDFAREVYHRRLQDAQS